MFVAGRRLGLALVAAGILAGATACGGAADRPRTLPPVTATTPAADTTSAPQHHSRAADLAAVKAVVREYYRAINRLRHEMNASGLAALMTRSCTCREQVLAVRKAAMNGERYTDHVVVVSISPSLISATTADVLVQYNAAPGGLESASGKRLTTSAAQQGLKRYFTLIKQGDKWLIDSIRAA